MRYLGRLHGEGVVTADGREIGRAAYDFDGFAVPHRGVTGSGEIRLRHAELALVFAGRNVRLRTDDGRVLDLRFSDRDLRGETGVAHVDVAGQLPIPSAWNH